jgi:hypothetical protein
MEKENSKIKVVDKQTGHIFLEVSFEEREKACSYAAELEEMGLDIEILSPTLSESLLNSLGASPDETNSYLKSLEEEIDAHESPICSNCL